MSTSGSLASRKRNANGSDSTHCRIGRLGNTSSTKSAAVSTIRRAPDPKLRGAPEGHVFNVRDVYLTASARFMVVLSGDMMTMPGLPKVPASDGIDIDADGNIVGLDPRFYCNAVRSRRGALRFSIAVAVVLPTVTVE